MQQINILGLKVVGMTGIILLVIFGMYWGGKKVISSLWGSQQAEQVVDSATNSEPDAGSEGFFESIKNLYQTNPSTPASQESPLPTPHDQTIFDTENIVSELPTGIEVPALDTYTQKYLAQLPEDATPEEVINIAQIEAFIEQNKGPLLPEIPDTDIKKTNASGEEAVKTYLDQVSSAHNPSLQPVSSTDIEIAFRKHYASGQPEDMNAIMDKLEQNLSTIKSAETPAETLELHRKLVGASQALLDNVLLLRDMPKDFIGGLIGAKKIEELGTVFNEIAQEATALEAKYGLQ